MKFKEFIYSVPKIKNIPLPARASQFKMSPPFREELLERYKNEMKHAQQAAVLALCYPDKNDMTMMALILRKTYHGVHSAQIGFPGGRIEPSDNNLLDTAVRETQEEIGVPGSQVTIIKELTDLYIPPSNFNVQPFLGIHQTRPVFIKQEDEVEDIVEVPLNHILDDQLVIKAKVPTSNNMKIEVPAFNFCGHVVWGATAMMLSEIKDLLKQAL
ncbi:MAG: CoA pyrophosphatase [Bacteroidia bacterium]|nr:CoA pyrophosphatase [Bacteroidia bacterium]